MFGSDCFVFAFSFLIHHISRTRSEYRVRYVHHIYTPIITNAQQTDNADHNNNNIHQRWASYVQEESILESTLRAPCVRIPIRLFARPCGLTLQQQQQRQQQ